MSVPTEVRFFSDGLRLSGWLSPGVGQAPRPAIVFCPGFTGTKYAAFYQPYVERFSRAGYTVLLIDYRGWGDSEGERGAIFPLQQVEDIRSALSYLESRDDVDRDRLGLFGVSFGGGHASYVASVDDRVRGAVSVSGVGDGGRWLHEMRREYEWHELLDRLAAERTRRAATGEVTMVDPTEEIMISTPERRATTVKGSVPAGMAAHRTPLHCAQAIIDYRPVDAVASRATTGVLWLAVTRDSVVPAEHSRRMFAAAAEPKRLVTLPGERHYAAYVEHLEVIAHEAISWYGARFAST
ncbi:MAG TPA: alpha/beta fold hydrolase [Candidatus Limnocylindria bacterium]|nr:alpha/beta fold hydrolase [Candidatus Limnocylindria bacterium]